MIDLDKELESALTNRVAYGNLRGLQATADDYLRGVDALLFDEAVRALPNATVSEREAWVRRHEDHKAAVAEKAKRYGDWEAAKLKMAILFAANEKYRTDQATDRTMMRASQ